MTHLPPAKATPEVISPQGSNDPFPTSKGHTGGHFTPELKCPLEIIMKEFTLTYLTLRDAPALKETVSAKRDGIRMVSVHGRKQDRWRNGRYRK